MLAALVRPIFNAEELAGARDQLSAAVAALEGKLDKVAGMLEQAQAALIRMKVSSPGRPAGVRFERRTGRVGAVRGRLTARLAGSPRPRHRRAMRERSPLQPLPSVRNG